jgi:hypothetical protein
MKKIIFLSAVFILTLFAPNNVFASECTDTYGGTCSDNETRSTGEIALGTSKGLFGCQANEYCYVLKCEGEEIKSQFGNTVCLKKSNCAEQLGYVLDCKSIIGSDGVCCKKAIVNITNPSTQSTQQGIVPCGGPTDPCTICHLIIGISNLVNFGKNILVTLTIVGIFIAGIMYIVSAGSEKMITQAKAFFTASLVGFAITLAAWLIVNVTIFWIANANPDLGVGVSSWNTFTCDKTSSALTGGTASIPTQTSTGAGGNCGGLPAQTNIDKQCGDASSELNTLLSCVQGKLGNKVTISSISDGNGGLDCYENHPAWGQCPSSGGSNCCYHEKGSLHYANGGSRAADLVGSGASNNDISSSVNACNGRAKDEDNHIHASV